jgi:hypothetical protein
VAESPGLLLHQTILTGYTLAILTPGSWGQHVLEEEPARKVARADLVDNRRGGPAPQSVGLGGRETD